MKAVWQNPAVTSLCSLMPAPATLQANASAALDEAPLAPDLDTSLTAHDDEAHLLGTMRAGAVAYLLKTTSDETLVETIRLVHQGKHIVSPSLMDPVLRRFKELAEAQVRHELGLSDEEIKVLRLIADGATNEEIALETHWSERTVKREIEEIMSKLGARNRAQAAAEAIRRGLI